jgi:hypothetical protein
MREEDDVERKVVAERFRALLEAFRCVMSEA